MLRMHPAQDKYLPGWLHPTFLALRTIILLLIMAVSYRIVISSSDHDLCYKIKAAVGKKINFK